MAHVSLITLGVNDLDRATRFYEAMGWHASAASVDGTVSFLVGGAVVLSLFGRDDLAVDAGVPPGPADRTSVALAMNVATEAAVDEALGTAFEAGGTISREAVRAEWGGYAGYFTDLDGHLWEVAHNPGFGLLPDGRVELPDGRAEHPDVSPDVS